MQRFYTFTISLVALLLIFSFLIAGTNAANVDEVGENVARLYEKSTTRAEIREIINKYYALDARFQDPFFDVSGIDKIRTQFISMYEAFDSYTLDGYAIHAHPETDTVDIVSDATYVIAGRKFELSQKTRLTLNDKNKVVFHHDIFQGSFVEKMENTPILREAFTGWRKFTGLLADPILRAKYGTEE